MEKEERKNGGFSVCQKKEKWSQFTRVPKIDWKDYNNNSQEEKTDMEFLQVYILEGV